MIVPSSCSTLEGVSMLNGENLNALEDIHVMNQSQSRYVERTNKREPNSSVKRIYCFKKKKKLSIQSGTCV